MLAHVGTQKSMAASSRPQLGETLIDRGLITRTALEISLSEQKVTEKRLGSILVRNGFISQRQMVELLREQDADMLAYESTYITQCPAELLLSTKTKIFVEDIDAIFLATYSNEDEVEEQLRPYYPGVEFKFTSIEITNLEEYLEKLEGMADNEEGFAERVIRKALMMKASDIHIEPRDETFSIFVRVLGVRQHILEGSLEDYQILNVQIKERANIDLADVFRPGDGGYGIEYNGQLVDLRVSTIPNIHGEKIVIRLLDPDNAKPNLDNLGITDLPLWRMGASADYGICLICGPTGSGKTTTLNASIRESDRFGKSVFSLEDPVEYRIPFISQTNINDQVGLDFKRGLKSLLRDDPDIIVVGELRDLETLSLAIRAAETGHLVLATLHTGSINGTFDRIRDMGVDPRDIRGMVRSILVQRLVRVFCKACGGDGCVSCNSNGYADRSVVSECAYFQSAEEVDRAFSGEQWWPSMAEDAVEKVKQGTTRESEIVRVFGERGRVALLAAGLDAPEIGNY